MPDLAKVEAITAKLVGAEPALENATAPPDGSSGAGSAPSDAAGGGAGHHDGAQSPGGATIDHDALQRKLDTERARRADAARSKRVREDRAAAKKAREEAEAEKAKYDGIGKTKTWLEAVKALGHDPAKAFEEMRAEALKAGTPEARMEAMDRAWEARFESLAKELKDERDARAAEKKASEEETKRSQADASERGFHADFRATSAEPAYESLLEEYEPAQLYPFVASMRDNPDRLFASAKQYGVALTAADGTFTMVDILNVLKAQQTRHFTRLEEQRRKKVAAPQTSPVDPKQSTEAKRPTVNGTAERNAGTSLGNSVASTRAADPASHKGESREQRVKRLANKYG